MRHVIKFGGTCFGNKNKYQWILETIKKNYIDKNILPVLVVSAISRDSKESGTTSNLLNCLNIQSKPKYLDIIKHDHLSIIDDLNLSDNTILQSKLINNFNEIDVTSNISATIDYIPNELIEENIIKIGERMSSEILNAYFIKNNITSSCINLENIINDTTLNHNTDIYNKSITNKIRSEFLAVNYTHQQSLITGGYIGAWGSYGGILNVLERGYSDYTGALVSEAISADKFEVYKESSAIFTLNPTKYVDAKIVKKMTYNDLNLLTKCGNEALNHNATNILKNNNIPITIRNAFSDTLEKTDIYDFKNADSVVALADKNCSILNIDISDLHLNTNETIEYIKNNYQIYACTYSYGKMSLVINECNEDMKHFGELQNNKKIISIIGNFMTEKVGFASKICKIVSKLNVNLQTHNTNHMSFVIDSKNSEKIMNQLNKELFVN